MPRISPYQKVNLNTTLRISLFGAFLGFVFVHFAKGSDELYPFLNGVAAGTLIGLFISLMEVYLFARNARKIKFFWFFLIRLSVYVVSLVFLLVHVAVFSQMMRLDQSYLNVINSEQIRFYLYEGSFKAEVIYIMVFAILINFTRVMSIKLGQGVLQNYIRGTYFNPVKEDRIFMFLKLVDSDQHMKRLGPLQFHKFLNKYFYDLSSPIIAHKGVIYEYVEDLLVITWDLKKGTTNSNCIELFYALKAEIQKQEFVYKKQFGFRPEFYASVHVGTVIGAEIGEIKTQIVFQGDTLNTTSRILDQSFLLNKELLISEDLEGIVELPAGLRFYKIENVLLKGKSKEKTLFSVETLTSTKIKVDAV